MFYQVLADNCMMWDYNNNTCKCECVPCEFVIKICKKAEKLYTLLVSRGINILTANVVNGNISFFLCLLVHSRLMLAVHKIYHETRYA